MSLEQKAATMVAIVQGHGRDGSAVIQVWGHHGCYQVTRSERGVLRCTCPAWRRCSHIVAAIAELERVLRVSS